MTYFFVQNIILITLVIGNSINLVLNLHGILTFSIEYWRWHHRFLQDAVQQYGYPTLFITLSPFEWTFPFPQWLRQARSVSGKAATELPALETMHIVHVLEQVVRGYLCGSNTNRWTSHVFNYNHKRNSPNVTNYFYRLEFQGRGTAHVHLLVWLKNLAAIQYDQIRADIPWSDAETAYLVSDLQPSVKDAFPLHDGPTEVVVKQDGKKELHLHHPADGFAINLRAYISSLLPFLKCKMDVQVTDNKAMILRYVTAYVSKFRDQEITESLYSRHVTSAMAAYRHLSQFRPLEPEMIVTLSSSKPAWTNNSTKRYVPPRPHNAQDSALVQKYLDRAPTVHDYSFLQYLRTHDTNKANPTPYKQQVVLVGVKYVSVYNNHFFFQHTLLNVPFTSLDDIRHPSHDALPEDLRYFAAAMIKLPDLWTNDDAIREFFRQLGNKEYYVSNVVNMVHSMRQLYHLWLMQVLTNADFDNTVDQETFALNQEQTQVLNKLKVFLRLRARHYASLRNAIEHAPFPTQQDNDDNVNSDDEAVDDSPEEAQPRRPNVVEQQYDETDALNGWTKIISILGHPGTGKTRCLYGCIQYLLSKDKRVLVATPTGFLASTYRAKFDSAIDCNTIHSAFSYPIDQSRPQVNYFLSTYDVILLDEISMVPLAIFRHILVTLQQLGTGPIVLVSGDKYQQQPIETLNGRIVPASNIYTDNSFNNMCVRFTLYSQHRCTDPDYQHILNHLRYWRPTRSVLNRLNAPANVLVPSSPVHDAHIVHALRDYPNATVITVSRAASTRVNSVVVNHFFRTHTALGEVQMDNDEAPMRIYKNMRVVITQNVNKVKGVVNGQKAIIAMKSRNTVLLRLPNSTLVSVFPLTNPITTTDQDGNQVTTNKTVFPFVPGYSITVCKAQGQTYDEAIIWMDSDFVPKGTGYVALSRVRTMQSIHFMTPLTYEHFKPVHYDDD